MNLKEILNETHFIIFALFNKCVQCVHCHVDEYLYLFILYLFPYLFILFTCFLAPEVCLNIPIHEILK